MDEEQKALSFINEQYKDLYKELECTLREAKNGEKTADRLKKFFNKLQKLFDTADSEKKQKHIKEFLLKKYVINEETLNKVKVHNNYLLYSQKKDIVSGQKESLSRWISFFFNEAKSYPMWLKYIMFQGIIKIGTFDDIKGEIYRRTPKTIKPFIELNIECAIKCAELVMEYIKKYPDSLNDFENIYLNGNFSQLYANMIRDFKIISRNNKEIAEGVWIKYEQESNFVASQKEEKGIVPEYRKLFDSLQGYATGWCTASSTTYAKAQICGNGVYVGGDFYVYYIKDINNEYRIPKIAIRMDGSDSIAEIRGTGDGQNVEFGYEEIISEKLKEFKRLSDEKRHYFILCINNMKKITELKQKIFRKEPFLIEDYDFILGVIKGFGQEVTSDVYEIRRKMPKANNIEIAKHLISLSGMFLEYIDNNIDGYKELAKEAITKNSNAMQFVNPDLEMYDELLQYQIINNLIIGSSVLNNVNSIKRAKIVAQGNESLFKYLSSEYKDNFEVAKIAVSLNGHNINYVSKNMPSYDELLKIARTTPEYIEEQLDCVKHNYYVPEEFDKELFNDKDFIKKALAVSPDWFYLLPDEIIADSEVKTFGLETLIKSIENTQEPPIEKNETESNHELAIIACLLMQLEDEPVEGLNLDIKYQVTDKKNMIDLINISSYAYIFGDENLKSDKEIIKMAIRKNWHIFLLLENKYHLEPDIVEEITKVCPDYMKILEEAKTFVIKIKNRSKNPEESTIDDDFFEKDFDYDERPRQ